jgi:hypothetical protein
MSKSKNRKRKTKGGPPKPRADAGTIEDRVAAVVDLRIKGARMRDVLRHVAEKEQLGEAPWTMDADLKPLCRRAIEYYCADAVKEIKAINTQHAENAMALAQLRVEDLYAYEMAAKNWEGAGAQLDRLHRLQDLLPSTRTVLAGDAANPMHLHHTEVSHHPTLTAADIAYAETLADEGMRLMAPEPPDEFRSPRDPEEPAEQP